MSKKDKEEPTRVREPFMSDQYIQIFDQTDKVRAAWKDIVDSYVEQSDGGKDQDAAEIVGLMSTAGAAFFTHIAVQTNIARSLERIAFALENRVD